MKLSNESYFSLNFIARKARPNKEGEIPIALRITMNGQRAEVYTNRYVAPNNWDASKGQSKGKTKKDLELNRYLDTIRTKICEIHNQLVMRDELVTDELKQLYEDISSEFPLIDIAVYSGHDITALQHHLSANNALYVEVTKEVSEAVFHYLIDKKIKAYHKPNSDFMCDYVDLSEHCVIVKPLVSESPVKKIGGICVPTLEKLLVDINADPDFYYLQGVEASYIMDNARSLYQLNAPKMLRYASRRGIREEMQSYIKNDKASPDIASM